jgi:hypothetical protein
MKNQQFFTKYEREETTIEQTKFHLGKVIAVPASQESGTHAPTKLTSANINTPPAEPQV